MTAQNIFIMLIVCTVIAGFVYVNFIHPKKNSGNE